MPWRSTICCVTSVSLAVVSQSYASEPGRYLGDDTDDPSVPSLIGDGLPQDRFLFKRLLSGCAEREGSGLAHDEKDLDGTTLGKVASRSLVALRRQPVSVRGWPCASGRPAVFSSQSRERDALQMQGASGQGQGQDRAPAVHTQDASATGRALGEESFRPGLAFDGGWRRQGLLRGLATVIFGASASWFALPAPATENAWFVLDPVVASATENASALEKEAVASVPGMSAEDFQPGPEGLLYRDLIIGSGETATQGDGVQISWKTKFAETGLKVKDVQNRKVFTAGKRQAGLPRGWSMAVLGAEAEGMPPMRTGGRREIITPPELGYAFDGLGCPFQYDPQFKPELSLYPLCIVQPNTTLDFTIDFVSVIK